MTTTTGPSRYPPLPAAPCEHAHPAGIVHARILTLTDPAQPAPGVPGACVFVSRGYRLDDRPGTRASRVTGLHLDAAGVLTATIRAMAEDVDVLTYPCGRHWRVFIADQDVLSPAAPGGGPSVRWIGPPGRPVAVVKAAAVAAEIDLHIGALRTEPT